MPRKRISFCCRLYCRALVPVHQRVAECGMPRAASDFAWVGMAYGKRRYASSR